MFTDIQIYYIIMNFIYNSITELFFGIIDKIFNKKTPKSLRRFVCFCFSPIFSGFFVYLAPYVELNVSEALMFLSLPVSVSVRTTI